MLKDKRLTWHGMGICVWGGAVLISLGYCCLLHTLGAFGGDSGYYVAQAKEILSDGLDYYRDHIATPYYWGYPTFLAACMAVFGENWTAVASVQIFLSAASTVFLFYIVDDILGHAGLSAALALFYKAILDTSMWDGRILSDSLGMTLECMTLYFFYMGMRDGKRKDYVLLAVFAVLFFLTRTNSISLLIVLAAAFFLRMQGKKKWIVAALAVVAAAAVLAVLFVAGEDAVHGLGSRVDYYIGYYQQGEIVSGRPEYDYQVPSGHLGSPVFALDISLMVLLKLKYYWSIYFSGYSGVHISICIVTVLPVFVFTFYSVIQVIRDGQRQLYPFVAGIASYCLLQIATEVDFDMRYRAPVFLLCIICCAYGAKKIRSMHGGS